MPIVSPLWYTRVGLYNINNNCRLFFRINYNTINFFYNPLLTVFFVVEMLISFVFTWSVHYGKPYFFNTFTADDEYSRQNGEKLQLPLEMQLYQK